MVHEYRERADFPGRCAACGHLYARCRGTKPIDLAFLRERPEFGGMFWPPTIRSNSTGGASSWEAWCQRYGVDPNTPDESLLDDFLHGRMPVRFKFREAAAKARAEILASMREKMVNRPWDAYLFAWNGPPGIPPLMLAFRDDAQREFYASYEDYDRAYAGMPKVTRDLQDRAERVELERLWRL